MVVFLCTECVWLKQKGYLHYRTEMYHSSMRYPTYGGLTTYYSRGIGLFTARYQWGSTTLLHGTIIKSFILWFHLHWWCKRHRKGRRMIKELRMKCYIELCAKKSNLCMIFKYSTKLILKAWTAPDSGKDVLSTRLHDTVFWSFVGSQKHRHLLRIISSKKQTL